MKCSPFELIKKDESKCTSLKGDEVDKFVSDVKDTNQGVSTKLESNESDIPDLSSIKEDDNYNLIPDSKSGEASDKDLQDTKNVQKEEINVKQASQVIMIFRFFTFWYI